MSEPQRKQVAALPIKTRSDGRVRVLLVTSRETRRWVIPKGWPMRGKSSRQAAAQEAWEEAGAKGTVSDRPIGEFDYLKRMPKGEDVRCNVKVYRLDVTSLADSWPEAHERVREWVSPAEAAERVVEPGLRAIFLELAGGDRLDGREQAAL